MAAVLSARAPGLLDNYTQRPRLVPAAVWTLLRLATLALALFECALLFERPRLGLALFWTVAVPLLPGLFAVAPGLWRQVCPMAFMNQLPRLLGRGTTRALPSALRYWSYLIGVALLVVFVALRQPLFNRDATATGALCVASLALALAGGLLFKGRSGWCGTFCPLAPVQRAHGQAPWFVVRNGYCPTCVGCQKNCYDFNPRAAVFGDLDDADPRHAAQRRLFMAMLPGLIVGYYLTPPPAGSGGAALGGYALALGGCMAVSGGVYLAATALFKASAYRVVSAFSAAALLLYYVWAGPVLVRGLPALVGLLPEPGLVLASRFIGVPIVIGLWRASLAGERAYRALSVDGGGVRIDDSRLRPAPQAAAGAVAAPAATSIQIVERQSGKCFAARAEQTLLEAMEAAGIDIEFGCRSGLCGADPVAVLEGERHLDAPGADELATLRRLGLEGRARMACCAHACGPVTISREPVASITPAPPSSPTAIAAVDVAAAAGIARVVVVGNGVAGITVAETLRRESASLQITLVAEEPLHFYNRMALPRAVNGRGSFDSLALLPESWYGDRRIDVRLATRATAIDRAGALLHLDSGAILPYDRLVLATGAAALPPLADYADYANAHVLRDIADAHAIRAAAQRASRALVVGGGVLGIEAAEALARQGLRVTLLHRGDRLLERQLDREGSQRLAGYLENSGIAVVTGARVAAIEGAQRHLSALCLDDGRRFEADLCVACVGVAPNVELARGAALAVGRGIVVDAAMRTADARIWAVGDAAEPLRGAAPGLWTTAVEQARIAAAAILGQGLPASGARNVLRLKSDGIDLLSWGDVETVPTGAVRLTAGAAATAWWSIVAAGGELLGAVHVGPPGSGSACAQLLKVEGDVTAALATWRARAAA
ncbi:MAG: FAD-dependent oxidoreductase [Burkholderiales bacterium]|nr:FAD-dependent oxidoreductase [Burkholderiales bacterium]